MKELITIQEKAKAYDEAIERAKEQLDGAKVFDYKEKQIAHDIRTTTYAIFPELKESESEDEKIIKWLIEGLRNSVISSINNGFDIDMGTMALAWLEKQREQKFHCDKLETFVKEWRDRYFYPDDIDKFIGFAESVIKWYQQNEQNPTWSEEDERKLAESIALIRSNNTGTFYYEKDELSSFLKSLKDRVQPQPKQEWSEDDKEMINNIIDYMIPMPIFFESTNGKSGKEYTQEFVKNAIKWLKSLKDRVGCEVNCTTTKEWSEEDEDNRINAIKYLELFDAQGIHGNVATPCINWLKSLKEKFVKFDKGFNVGFSAAKYNQWKPSEDQIEALAWALSLAKNCGEECAFDLRTLQDQLKKLKE